MNIERSSSFLYINVKQQTPAVSRKKFMVSGELDGTFMDVKSAFKISSDQPPASGDNIRLTTRKQGKYHASAESPCHNDRACVDAAATCASTAENPYRQYKIHCKAIQREELYRLDIWNDRNFMQMERISGDKQQPHQSGDGRLWH